MEDFIIDSLKKNLGCRFTSLPSSLSPETDFCYFEDINWLIHSLSRYALDDIGYGSHVHLSLWENGKNAVMASGGHSKHGMSKVGEEFMAGVLTHLPSILAFTAPLPNRLPFTMWVLQGAVKMVWSLLGVMRVACTFMYSLCYLDIAVEDDRIQIKDWQQCVFVVLC
ncbi:Glutamine synthetase [Camellia lanceoleosa]|uniref:Glutamine synthetase n=1 Tax=Camellia lanceoleosa TaxID=1840588 RepID=A0ACC0F474_9ERIC|nr:Glutamine synthetase [Camellia lanceoleosa]